MKSDRVPVDSGRSCFPPTTSPRSLAQCTDAVCVAPLGGAWQLRVLCIQQDVPVAIWLQVTVTGEDAEPLRVTCRAVPQAQSLFRPRLHPRYARYVLFTSIISLACLLRPFDANSMLVHAYCLQALPKQCARRVPYRRYRPIPFSIVLPYGSSTSVWAIRNRWAAMYTAKTRTPAALSPVFRNLVRQCCPRTVRNVCCSTPCAGSLFAADYQTNASLTSL